MDSKSIVCKYLASNWLSLFIGACLLVVLVSFTGCKASVDLDAPDVWLAILGNGDPVSGTLANPEEFDELLKAHGDLYLFDYYGRSPIVRRESRYSKGKLVYHVNRTISGERTGEWVIVQNGSHNYAVYHLFHPNMLLKAEKHYREVNGKQVRCGIWRVWDDSGQLLAESKYKDGELVGERKLVEMAEADETQESELGKVDIAP